MAIFDDPVALFDDHVVTFDSGGPTPPTGITFTPPTDDIVPPIYVVEDRYYPSVMNPLFRHYKNQSRGRNIFLMSDGTIVDSQLQYTPPNMIQPPTDPYARYDQVVNGQSTDFEIFQVPYVVRTYYGGSANEITAAEKAILNAAGYATNP